MTPEEYRIKLLTKLSALIAVISVAITKLAAEQARTTDADRSLRLQNIMKGLMSTRQICVNARTKLSGTKTAPAPAPKRVPPKEAKSISEYQRFKTLDPISADDIANVNLEDLCKKLQQ